MNLYRKAAAVSCLVAGIFFLAGIIVPLSADTDPYIEGEIDLIDRLANEGHPELARRRVEQIEESTTEPEELRNYVSVLRANIRKIEANLEADLERRIELLHQARDLLETFVEEYRGQHSQWGNSKIELGHVLRDIGGTHTERYNDVPPDDQQSVVRKGQNAFQQARQTYDEAKEYFVENEDDMGQMRADFFTTVAMYEQARLLREADRMEEMKRILESTLPLIEEFQWDYAGTVAERRITLFKAMVSYNLHRYYHDSDQTVEAAKHREEARRAFRNVTRFAERIPRFRQEERPLVRSLIVEAYYHWTKTLVENEEHTRALEIANEAMNIDQELIGKLMAYGEGRGIFLEYAKALFFEGRRQQALQEAERVAQRGGVWGARARRLIQEWGAMVHQDVAPETWYRQMRGALETAQAGGEGYARSIHYARRALQRLGTEAEQLEWRWKFMEHLAITYTETSQWYEAAIVYGELHDQYRDIFEDQQRYLEHLPTDEIERIKGLVPRWKYYQAQCITFARAGSGLTIDEKEFQEHLTYITEHYPDSRWAPQARLLVGDMHREAGDYTRAIESYRDTGTPGTRLYEQVQLRLGLTYYRWGNSLFEEEKKDQAREKLQQAVSVLSEYLDYTREHSPPGEESARRDNRWRAHRFMALSYMHEAMKAYDRVAELFENIADSEFTEEQKSSAHFFLFEAEFEQGNLEAAEEIVQTMIDLYPRGNTDKAQAIGMLADHYYERREEDLEAWEQAAHYAYEWIPRRIQLEGRATRFDVYAMATRVENFAQKMEQLNRDEDAIEYYGKAQELYDLLTKSTFQGVEYNLGHNPERTVPDDWSLERSRARIMTRLGGLEGDQSKLEQARNLYNQLEEQHEGSPGGYFLLEKGRLNYELFMMAYEAGDDEWEEYWEDANKVLRSILSGIEPGTDLWWDVRYRLVRLAEERNDHDEALSMLQMMRRRLPDEFEERERIQEVWRRLN